MHRNLRPSWVLIKSAELEPNAHSTANDLFRIQLLHIMNNYCKAFYIVNVKSGSSNNMFGDCEPLEKIYSKWSLPEVEPTEYIWDHQ